MSHDSPPEERMIYVGNFAEQVDEEMLEELFIQTGPVVKVMIRDIKDSTAKYALIEFEDEATVLFAIELMNGVKLFNKEINVKPRNGTKQEELYRRKRGEIEERLRTMMADLGGGDRERDRDRRSYDSRRDYQRDRSPHSRDSGGGRDWDRNSRSNSRNSSSGGRDSSWQPRHQNRQHNEYQLLPPPPPPPPLMGGGGSWRGGGGPPAFNTPQMLPHQHFVNMMQQQSHRSAPAYTDRHQNQYHQNTPRHQRPDQQQYDRRRGGSDRNAANHRNSHGGRY